jgi:hypothetical protein
MDVDRDEGVDWSQGIWERREVGNYTMAGRSSDAKQAMYNIITTRPIIGVHLGGNADV